MSELHDLEVIKVSEDVRCYKCKKCGITCDFKTTPCKPKNVKEKEDA